MDARGLRLLWLMTMIWCSLREWECAWIKQLMMFMKGRGNEGVMERGAYSSIAVLDISNTKAPAATIPPVSQ